MPVAQREQPEAGHVAGADEHPAAPVAPAAAYAHVGNGTNVIYVDPENDLVVVARWIENGAVDGFITRVLASVSASAAG